MFVVVVVVVLGVVLILVRVLFLFLSFLFFFLTIPKVSESIGLDFNKLADAQLGVWQNTVTTLQDSASLTLEDLVNQGNPNCEDLAAQGPMLNLLREGLGNESLGSCADALAFCDSVSKMPEWELDGGKGFLTRMLCSESCGCSNPSGDFVHVQGCPYGRNRPCTTSSNFKAVLSSTTCQEKSAAELRSFGPWVSWITKLRAFANTPSNGTLLGQSEAYSLAEAMWNNGCEFGNNLTAQNITWGDCFEWSAALGWEFKTLEYFCPMTCGCDRGKINSACPQPQGLTCDETEFCVLIDTSYYCPGDVPVVFGTVEVDLSGTVAQQITSLAEPLLQAFRIVLGSLAEVVPEAVKIEFPTGAFEVPPDPPPERRLRTESLSFQIFLLSELEPPEVESIIAATALDVIAASHQEEFEKLVPNVNTTGLTFQSITTFNPAKAWEKNNQWFHQSTKTRSIDVLPNGRARAYPKDQERLTVKIWKDAAASTIFSMSMLFVYFFGWAWSAKNTRKQHERT